MADASGGATRQHPNPRHLEYVVAVAEHGSIKAAADALFVASSGISQAISDLERRLGTTLFVRGRKGAVPTSHGRMVVEAAQRALVALDAVSRAGDGAPGLRGQAWLDVVTLPSLARHPAASLLATFQSQEPGLRVRLSAPALTNVSAALDPVLTGDCDAAITELPERPVPGVRLVPLPDLEYYAVCPPGTRPAVDGVFDVQQLAELGLVVGPAFESSEVRRRLERLSPDLVHRIVVRTDHRDSLEFLAMAGAGVALLHATQARDAAARGGVSGRIRGMSARRICLAVRNDEPSALVARLVSWVQTWEDLAPESSRT